MIELFAKKLDREMKSLIGNASRNQYLVQFNMIEIQQSADRELRLTDAIATL